MTATVLLTDSTRCMSADNVHLGTRCFLAQFVDGSLIIYTWFVKSQATVSGVKITMKLNKEIPGILIQEALPMAFEFREEWNSYCGDWKGEP